MLDPADRTVLTEALRPPIGFRLDQVIATTYTLDLVALLTLPLSFTLSSGDGITESGVLTRLLSWRRFGGTPAVLPCFVRPGASAVPRRGQLLFGYLEFLRNRGQGLEEGWCFPSEGRRDPLHG